MPWLHAIFTDAACEKIAEHGISEDEVEYVLQHAFQYTIRRSSGLPIARGVTAAGRWVVVVYRELDAVTCEIITAYEPQPL